MTAEAWIIGLHLMSWHAPNCHDDNGHCVRYEKATTGLYAKAASGFTFGAYKNSYGHNSVYVGLSVETDNKRFALTVAAVTGYPRGRIVPMVMPNARFDLTKELALRVAGAPGLGKSRAALLHVAIERTFL